MCFHSWALREQTYVVWMPGFLGGSRVLVGGAQRPYLSFTLITGIPEVTTTLATTPQAYSLGKTGWPTNPW